jgi:GDPmannose 4,6-dehydratase
MCPCDSKVILKGDLMRALICGISGQDGAYLAELLLEKGYQVWGTSRDAQMASFNGLKQQNILNKINILSMAPNDFRSVLMAISRSEPDEIYYLAGQSSVGLSFDQPVETLESITIGTLNLLEAIRFINKSIRFYHASSSECFGDNGEVPSNELVPFRPRSPYAVAKASAHWMVINYRESYGLYACNGILFNHESPLRPARFVTKKIISEANKIAKGQGNKLQLGRLDIVRDWGWAPEYVNAMWLMLQQPKADDFVIATGKANSLETFVKLTFDLLNLDWKKYVLADPSLFRPSDLFWSQGDPQKANNLLGWRSQLGIKDIISNMIEAERSIC